jgi:putative CocE/NonD family hydrolase
MRLLSTLLLVALLASPAQARAADTVAVPATLRADTADRLMPAFARKVMVSERNDGQPDLGILFRQQLAAGDYAAAVDSIRTVRGDNASQPPLYLQYEIYAQARALAISRGIPFAQAWNESFAERFGKLDDRTALQAEFSFGGNLSRMRADLDKALAEATGKRQLPLPEARELVRAWQVFSAYSAFQPLFDAALQRDDARRYVVARDVLVRMPDGAQVTTLIVRPANVSPLPALLTFTIYANDTWAWADAKKAAAYGYAGVVAYARGKGRSPDAITPYAHDGADAAAVVDWIATQPWNDGRVGMYGGSYSGYTQWAALKHRPKALKAIAASASVAPAIDVPMEGNIFLNFLYSWPVYVASNRTLDDAHYNDGARWSALDRKWYASGRAYKDLPAIDGQPNPVFSEWLQHPAYDARWQDLIPQGDDFAGIDIPVLATTGYFDGAQIGVLHYFREHLRHRPDADHTLLIGPFEHFAMQAGVPPVVQGYPTDPSARVDLQALRLAWFDHVLKGAPKPELLAARVNWQVMGADAWRHADTLDAMATRKMQLCLAPGSDNGANILSPQPRPEASTMQRVDFSGRSDVDVASPSGVMHRELDPRAGLVFVGEPMQRDTELAGAFEGVLDFIVNKRDVDVMLGIYERNAAGDYLDLSWWMQRASYNTDRRHRTLLQPGVPQRLVVSDTRLLGRKLAAGSRLVVTLGVIKQPDRELNLGSGKEPSAETIADAGPPLEIRWSGTSCLRFGVRG